MPTVHNPSQFSVRCGPADQEIPAGGTIVVSDEVAAKVSPCILIVEDTPAPEPEPATKPAATRETATRGGKAAEVTGKPKGETR
jgi:hypothetical protein